MHSSKPTTKRITIVSKPEYEAQLEYDDQYVALHLIRMGKFSKSIYLDIIQRVDEAKDLAETFCKSQLFAGIFKGDKVTAKLLGRLKFEYLGEHGGFEVYVYNKENEL